MTEYMHENMDTSQLNQSESASSIEKREIVERIISTLNQKMVEAGEGEPFHNAEHPKHVLEDAHAILGIFERYGLAASDQKLVVDTATAGHDVIIEYVGVSSPGAFNYGQRLRFRGFEQMMPPAVRDLVGERKGNEEASWLEIEKVVRESDPSGLVYTPDILAKIKAAVGATYPDAGMVPLPAESVIVNNPNAELKPVDLGPYLIKDKEGRYLGLKFDQPLLNPDSDISTLAVAFGDLMYAGKVDSATFRQRGNGEFREISEKMSYYVGKGMDQISSEDKPKMATAMLGWIKSQISFVLWQKIRFNEVIENFKAIIQSPEADKIKNDFKALYCNFDTNLVDAKERVDETEAKFGALRKTETYTTTEGDQLFQNLLIEMGYEEKSVV